MKTFPALPLFRIGRTKLFALLGLGLGLSGALSRLQAVTLQVGDILVSDSGTNAANTKLYQLPVSGTPPLNGVGGGTTMLAGAAALALVCGRDRFYRIGSHRRLPLFGENEIAGSSPTRS